MSGSFEGGQRRFRDMNAAQSDSDVEEQSFKYFHISGNSNLTELVPRRGKYMTSDRNKSAFFTTKDHIPGWVSYLSDHGNKQEMYVYGVTLPKEAVVEEGADGAEHGDFKIVGDQPLKVTYLYALPGIRSKSDSRRDRASRRSQKGKW